MSEGGWLAEPVQEYIQHARKTYDFLENHVFLPNGACRFRLTREGEPIEEDVSFYADCFVVLGYTEFARLTKDRAVLEKALALFDHIERRLAAGQVRSEPYPVPAGYEAHGFSMILLNVSQELAGALEEAGHERAADLRQRSSGYMEKIMTAFCTEEGIILEVIPADGSSDTETLLGRHVNPGHAIECMWFVITEAKKLGRDDVMEQALKVVRKSFELGWDPEFGGLLRYVDRNGGQPRGRRMEGDRRFEELVNDTWDLKLWWPHSEAVYTSLLCYSISGQTEFQEMYKTLKAYTFGTFPSADPQIGEWVQIRNRDGRPADRVAALPVKDPYHILRNLLLAIQLLN